MFLLKNTTLGTSCKKTIQWVYHGNLQHNHRCFLFQLSIANIAMSGAPQSHISSTLTAPNQHNFLSPIPRGLHKRWVHDNFLTLNGAVHRRNDVVVTYRSKMQ